MSETDTAHLRALLNAATAGELTDLEAEAALASVQIFTWGPDGDRFQTMFLAAMQVRADRLSSRANFLLDERDALAAEVARLREALDYVCRQSNPDWTEARVYPTDLLDDIHELAVRAYYGWEKK